MQTVTTTGLIAKPVFQVHGVDAARQGSPGGRSSGSAHRFSAVSVLPQRLSAGRDCGRADGLTTPAHGGEWAGRVDRYFAALWS
jgi:hypothetical protein